MPLPFLIDRVRSARAFGELSRELPGAGASVRVAGVYGSLPALVLAGLHRERPERVWVAVADTPDAAEDLLADLEALLGEESAALFPQRESLPYEEGESHVEVGGRRVETLEALLTGRVRTLVTTLRALQERFQAPRSLDDLRLVLRTGEERSPAGLAARLEEMGFEPVPAVESVGQFASRGGILDVFGFGTPEPVRVEFLGNKLESIRHFEVLTQRSTREVAKVHLLPVDFRAPTQPGSDREAEPERRSLLDFLPADTVVAHTGQARLEDGFARTWAEVEKLHLAESGRGRGVEPPEHLFLTPGEATRAVASRARLFFGGAGLSGAPAVDLGGQPPATIDRNLPRLGTLLRETTGRDERAVILCDNPGQLERLQEILDELKAPANVTLAVGSLSGGFKLPDAHPPLVLLTDHEIFRRGRRLRRKSSFRGGAPLESFAALKPGEYVVHLDHGVGRFREMERVRVGDGVFDTLAIEYANGDILRVPVHRVDLIERWTPDRDDSPPPRVHKIGGREWTRTKNKARRAILDMTAELVELYARRHASPGRGFSPDTRWQREMESSFLFEDTPDQRQATLDVKRDMEASRPMDRLICGDVGYGKTEVAIRAAFKAVQDGAQVAVLVPTTILAEQHLHTFRERLAGYPVRVEALSRFRTPKAQKEILGQLSGGAVDVVIGTHRLLSRDVAFHDLGLVVVDEEQRFGVRHKERLKQLKESVDVLTLTATPIPRTLQMSLLGVRDLTVIETPPRDRQPIVTHLIPWSEALLEDAIQRETDRGGQVFLVHNRVETIDSLAAQIRRLVPDRRVGVAHGQMPEARLEVVMANFMDGEIDVLVSTSIIENGLDVPSANTLIVDRADLFGLAQLYQMRGRVGRSHHRAYCYLVVPDSVSEDAERRLRILEHYTELGSGHRIALKDLELRGAGDILGAEQSGFVHAVGFDTYMRLLEETIQQLKGEEGAAQYPPADVAVEGSAFIPDSYVPDQQQKLHLYRRLARASAPEEVAELRAEARDRYGTIPPEVDTLFATASLRLLGTALGVERILVRPDGARLTFQNGVVPRVTVLQRAFAGLQLEPEVRRTLPLSLELFKRGSEPVAATLVRALREVSANSLLAA